MTQLAVVEDLTLHITLQMRTLHFLDRHLHRSHNSILYSVNAGKDSNFMTTTDPERTT
jgi:hypothetical protein